MRTGLKAINQGLCPPAKYGGETRHNSAMETPLNSRTSRPPAPSPHPPPPPLPSIPSRSHLPLHPSPIYRWYFSHHTGSTSPPKSRRTVRHSSKGRVQGEHAGMSSPEKFTATRVKRLFPLSPSQQTRPCWQWRQGGQSGNATESRATASACPSALARGVTVCMSAFLDCH